MYTVCVGDFDGTAARAVGGVDGAAAFENLASLNGDGIGADRAGSNDGDTLTSADGVDGGLDSGTVVRTSVDVGGASSCYERATRASDPGIGCVGTALGGNSRDKRQRRSDKREVNYCCDVAIDVDDPLAQSTVATYILEEKAAFIFDRSNGASPSAPFFRSENGIGGVLCRSIRDIP